LRRGGFVKVGGEVVGEGGFGPASVMVWFEGSEVARGGCLGVFTLGGTEHAGEVAGYEGLDCGD